METWRDIVAEMRKESFGCKNSTQQYATPDLFFILADRIEAACKTLEDLLIVEQEENAKLRRALEPVMECEGMGCTRGYDGNFCEPCGAVREAQAIMRT